MHNILAVLLLSSIARADIPPPDTDTDSGSSKCEHVSPAAALPGAFLAAAALAVRRRSRNR